MTPPDVAPNASVVDFELALIRALDPKKGVKAFDVLFYKACHPSSSTDGADHFTRQNISEITARLKTMRVTKSSRGKPVDENCVGLDAIHVSQWVSFSDPAKMSDFEKTIGVKSDP